VGAGLGGDVAARLGRDVGAGIGGDVGAGLGGDVSIGGHAFNDECDWEWQIDRSHSSL
jgi:hypothetical protein